MSAEALPSLAEAIAADKAAGAEVQAAQQAIDDALERYRVAEEASRAAYKEMLAAEARESVGSIPIGTRVRHTAFAEAVGTVVEGTKGIAVRQDTTGKVTDGYGPGEWIAVES